MKPCRGWIGVAALGWLAAGAVPADAAWNNVFQVTCHCKRRAAVSFFAPAPQPAVAFSGVDPCPPRVTYRQRVYYTPVTTMRRQITYRPVQTTRREYFYEPVTSYRYTSYYDPCTCRCRRVATPVTSYRLRSRCNTVTRYVQRCRMVPVTSYRASYYYEPVCSDPCADAAPAAPTIDPGEAAPRPRPRIDDGEFEGGGTRIPPREVPTYRRYRSPEPPLARPRRPAMIARRDGKARLRGVVVYNDRVTPRPNARLIFTRGAEKRVVQADRAGRFDAKLPAGRWYMYVSDGREGVYHQTVNLRAASGDGDYVAARVVSRVSGL